MTEPRLTATHWGNFLVGSGAAGSISVTPTADDDAPSPIGRSLAAARDPSTRVGRPAVRLGYYRQRRASDTTRRGCEPFVEVEWDEALDIVAEALDAARTEGGHRAIYGGSYGWASAGRFHHAPTQLHRFLQLFGGYTTSVDTYSLAAGEVIIPHILGMNVYAAAKQAPTTDEIVRHCSRIVFFGGGPSRNTQVGFGGSGSHEEHLRLEALAGAGIDMVNIGPIRDDLDSVLGARWIPCRPNSDVAVMLAMVHTLIDEDRHDKTFLATYTTGFDKFARYVMGRTDGQPKTPEWAQALSEVPADEIRWLARAMAEQRCLIGLPYALQRARHGEQTYWAAWALAAALGQIGLPAGGVLMGTGVGKTHTMERQVLPFRVGLAPQYPNPAREAIPVARITEMLERPGGSFTYNGNQLRYPDIDLIYWAGGNPFHHHQDLNRLRRAWTKPSTVVVNEINWTATARFADIVLPTTTSQEREDFAATSNDHWLTPMRRSFEPYGRARDDYSIFASLAQRFGFAEQYTEGRDPRDWVRHLWQTTRDNAAAWGIELPDYDQFRDGKPLDLRPMIEQRCHTLELFREAPERHPLSTPSGKIEIFSQTIADYDYRDCIGHPAWYDDKEWLGARLAREFPLHLLSNQPATRLHSQLDNGVTSQESKIDGREPLRMNPDDAAARGLHDGDIVRVFNRRGAFLAGLRTCAGLHSGVAQIATGAWYDPVDPTDPYSVDAHGNPNVVTPDIGTSSLAQGPSSNSCLVQIERYSGVLPELRVRTPPEFASGETASADGLDE